MKFPGWIMPQSPRSMTAGLTTVITAYLVVGAVASAAAAAGLVGIGGVFALTAMFNDSLEVRQAASVQVIVAILIGLAGFLGWYRVLRPLGARTVIIGLAAFLTVLCASALAAFHFASPINTGRIAAMVPLQIEGY